MAHSFATIDDVGVIWKLPEVLKEHQISVYRLERTMVTRGTPMSPATAYRWAKELPQSINIANLKGVIEALRELTGEDIRLEHLLEYVPDET